MITIRSIFIALLSIASVSANAQVADSVTVILDDQKTVIPVPEFGKKTTITMSDSIQEIEIAVIRKRPAVNVQPDNGSEIKTTKKKTKWFSQVEAGYASELKDYDLIRMNNTSTEIYHYNNDLMPGFRLGLSIFDRERILNQHWSFTTGTNLNVTSNFRLKKTKTEPAYDSIHSIYNRFVDYDPYSFTSFQLLVPLGWRYSFLTGTTNSKISFGASVGPSFRFFNRRLDPVSNDIIRSYALSFACFPVIQPYLGFEYNKIGIRSYAEFSGFIPSYGRFSAKPHNVGLLFTYRFF